MSIVIKFTIIIRLYKDNINIITKINKMNINKLPQLNNNHEYLIDNPDYSELFERLN